MRDDRQMDESKQVAWQYADFFRLRDYVSDIYPWFEFSLFSCILEDILL